MSEETNKVGEEIEIKFRSWFMIVCEGNVRVKRGKGKIVRGTIEREVYYVEGNEEILYPPLDLIAAAEKQIAAKIGSDRMVATNVYRVLVDEEKLLGRQDAESEEE